MMGLQEHNRLRKKVLNRSVGIKTIMNKWSNSAEHRIWNIDSKLRGVQEWVVDIRAEFSERRFATVSVCRFQNLPSCRTNSNHG